jgi:cardiolipin synthase A/B
VRVAKRFNVLIIALSLPALYIFLIKAALSPALPSPSRPIILYSNQSRDDLRLILKNCFANAKNSLDLWMYAATDPLLLKQLEKRAHEGVTVTLRYDKKGGTPILPHLLHPQVMKSKGLMHRKIVVADDRLLFLGSANMTTSSLELHDNLSIGIYHEGASHFLKSPSQKNYSFQMQDSKCLLWLLPDPEAALEIEKHIHAATTSIFIAMFTLTQNKLIDALISAHKRGVAITLALDRYTARGASRKAVKKLSEAGINIALSSGLPLLHHKWAYIDQKQLILGSTNWTEAAFQKNDDVLLFIQDLSAPLRKQVESLISVIRMESNNAF